MAFDAGLFWTSMAITHGLGWGLLLLSARVIPRVWQDKPATAAKLRLLDRIRNLFQGSPPVRKLHRQRLLDMNPITWLAGRDRLKPLYPWLLLGTGLAGWLTGAIWIGRDWLSIPVTVISILSVHGVFRMWIASESGRKFSDDLRSGALELVLSTSLKLDEILDGQLLALRRQFLRASIGVLVIDLLLVFVCVTWGERLDSKDRIEFIVAAAAGMIMFAADMYTLGWTGMWHGISARDPNRSAGNATSQILFLPWAFCSVLWTSYGIFYAFCEAISLHLPGLIQPSFALALGSWFAIGLGNYLFFLHRCRKRLRQEFRGLTMRRYSGTTEKTFFQILTSFFWRGNSND